MQVAPVKQGSLGIIHCLTVSALSGKWIEIAFWTIFAAVQRQESVGQGPQLFQTFTVHTSHITKVMLSAKHLVSGRSNSKVYFLRKCSNIPGKALFHDGEIKLFNQVTGPANCIFY